MVNICQSVLYLLHEVYNSGWMIKARVVWKRRSLSVTEDEMDSFLYVAV